MHFLETCFFVFGDFLFFLKLILGGQFLSFFLAVSSSFFSACIRQRGTDGEDRNRVGGSPAGAPRPRLGEVVQPVRFFDLTPAVRATIAGIYAESDAGADARGGPGQIQIGRHSNVGADSGVGTQR